jgi:tRNA(Ser,Leu) C12 N-acetylase TAN1
MADYNQDYNHVEVLTEEESERLASQVRARVAEIEAREEQPKKDDSQDLLVVDINHLTIDDIETIEDIIDGPIDTLQDPRTRKGKILRAIAFVVKRRTNPNFTLEMAGQLRIQLEESAIPNASSGNS